MPDNSSSTSGGVLISNENSGDGNSPLNPKHKAAVRGGKRCKNKSSRKDKRTATPPTDHFFVLPPEIRNTIYEYVLVAEAYEDPLELEQEDRIYEAYLTPEYRHAGRQTRQTIRKNVRKAVAAELKPEARTYTTRKPRSIESGEDNEPFLLWACPQIRSEALGIYHSLSSLNLQISAEQLEGVRQWISSIRCRFKGDPDKVFGHITITLRNLGPNQLDSLAGLARIAQDLPKYFNKHGFSTVNPNVHKSVKVCWDPKVCPLKDFSYYSAWDRRLVFRELIAKVIRLGIELHEEERGEEFWDDFNFQEWLEERIEEVKAPCRLKRKPSRRTCTGAPKITAYKDSNQYRGVTVPVSDRKLRSSK